MSLATPGAGQFSFDAALGGCSSPSSEMIFLGGLLALFPFAAVTLVWRKFSAAMKSTSAMRSEKVGKRASCRVAQSQSLATLLG